MSRAGSSSGVRMVRAVAWLLAWTYPSTFRRIHGARFPEVAEHLWEREVASARPMRATVTTTRLLLADTLAGAPLAWMATVGDERHPRRLLHALPRGLGRWMLGGANDVQYAVRTFRRRPAASLLVALTLGLGIGASAAAFDALDRTVLRPLPFTGSDRLMFLVIEDVRRQAWTTPSLPLVATWRERASGLERIEIFRGASATLPGAQGVERVDALMMSGGLPDMLQVRPVLGRMLGPADALTDAPPAAMLTEQTWRTRFGGDPAVVGRVLDLGSRQPTVVGIWPAGARLDLRVVPELILVLPAGREYNRGSLAHVVGRREPGRTVAEVEAELRAISSAAPEVSDTEMPVAKTAAEAFLGEPFVQGVWLVFAGAIGLLVVAIVNAGHLIIGRAAARGHELGVRLALGGSMSRLARLFVAEGAVHVAAGVVAGVGVMALCEQVVRHYEPRLFMAVEGAGVEGRALLFISAAAFAAVVLCAVAPLLRAASLDIRRIIERGSEHRATSAGSRMSWAFVVVQAMLAVLLVCGAAVMVRSARNLMAVDTGVAIDRLATVGLSAPVSRYSTPEARQAFFRRVVGALESMPTVTGVTTSGMPLLGTSIQPGLAYLDGEPKPQAEDAAVTGLASVQPNYFDVLGMRVLAGRGFTADDDTSVAIVNEAFAASRGHDVLGKLVYTPMGSRPFRIVGVVSNTRAFGLANEVESPSVFFPHTGAPEVYTRFLVRTTGEPETVVSEARRRIAAIDPTIALAEAEVGSDVIRRQTAQHRFVAVLLAGLAALGFGLSLTGVYGTVALSVARRRREIGIRLALGATRGTVKRGVVTVALGPVIAGGLIGVAGAWLALPLAETLLFRIRPRDPVSAVAGLGLVAVAAAAAAWFPARRASRIDPAETLRLG